MVDCCRRGRAEAADALRRSVLLARGQCHRWRRQRREVANPEQAYRWQRFAATRAEWAAGARRRLLAWGFNTAGAWSVPPAEIGLPSTPELELGHAVQFVWTDPFDPALITELRRKAAAAVAPYRGNPLRIGYFSDNEIGWWNGPLFVAFSDLSAGKSHEAASHHDAARAISRRLAANSNATSSRRGGPRVSTICSPHERRRVCALAATALKRFAPGPPSLPPAITAQCARRCARPIRRRSISATVCRSTTTRTPCAR